MLRDELLRSKNDDIAYVLILPTSTDFSLSIGIKIVYFHALVADGELFQDVVCCRGSAN